MDVKMTLRTYCVMLLCFSYIVSQFSTTYKASVKEIMLRSKSIEDVISVHNIEMIQDKKNQLQTRYRHVNALARILFLFVFSLW